MRLTGYRILLIIFVCLLSTKGLHSQVSLPNTIEPLEIDTPIKFDGIPDEPCWQKAQKVTNFTQRELHEGQNATEKTEVAVCYTSETMYIGIWCWDSEPDKITAKYMVRDFQYWADDNFEIIFDTFLDKRSGYVFVINPNGARSDVLTTEDGRGFNMDWNGIWDAKTLINEKGWFAEIKIPFSSLKFPDKKIQNWGVNFERNIRRKQEQLFWQGWSRNYDFEHVSHAGTMINMKNITGKESVEIKPFITAGISRDSSTGSVLKIGGDANYLLTPTLKLNLTANTDFAQVESDRLKINLTRFSIFYPEKRDFFLESKGECDFDISSFSKVFYSRKIGIYNGGEIPIFGGVRLIGKEGRTNIGVLSIQTQKKDSIASTNYSVVRFSQDILEKSNVGMIFTAKNQPGYYNYVYGADLNYKTSTFLDDKNLILRGIITQSQTKDSITDRNLSYGLSVVYPNDFIYYELSLIASQKRFNPEIGYMERNNYKCGYTKFGIYPRPTFIPYIKKLVFEPLEVASFFTDETNELESAAYNFKPFGFVTNSGEYFDFSISPQFERLDNPFNIFADKVIPSGKYWFTRYNFNFNTFEGRTLSFSSYVNFGDFYNGKATSLYGSLNWSVSSHLMLAADYKRDNIELPEGSFYANEIGGRIQYAFNPKMNALAYGQWNNQSREIIINYRFHWIPVVGSDLYIVLNQTFDTNSGKLHLSNTTALTKFVWRFAF